MSGGAHTKLVRELTEGIASGRYPVGSLLPTEFALCEKHGLSRYAVRKALDELRKLGLISRRKNVGTRVEAQRPASGFTHSIATVDELDQFGARHVRVIRTTQPVVADRALAKELGCAGGSRWLRISGLRMESSAEARPICWTDVYVNSAYEAVGTLVRKFPETLISSLIESRYGCSIARIRQEIEALSVPPYLAGELQVAAGSPALKITRSYYDASARVFEISRSVHPADRFTFSMEMSRTRE